MSTSRARKFIVDSEGDPELEPLLVGTELCAADLSLDPTSEVAIRNVGFRVQSRPSSWDEVVTRWPDCGEDDIVQGRFAIRADDDRCLVEVRVRVLVVLIPAELEGIGVHELAMVPSSDISKPATVEDVEKLARGWRDEIRHRWSRKHKIRLQAGDCTCREYDVDIAVDFDVIRGPRDMQAVRGDYHFVVGFHDEEAFLAGTADSGNFDRGTSPELAAHEFGHWIGNADEYKSLGCWEEVVPVEWCPRECSGRITTTPQSIMWDKDGKVYLFHYRFFAAWLSLTKCCRFEIGSIQDIVDEGEEGRRFHSF